jgi:protein-S-isoprenylcysteine O-methyltransferase Ste14
MNTWMIALLVVLGTVSLVLAVAVGCAFVVSGRISREEREARFED